MKLVDILARELKVWPEGSEYLWQSFADAQVYTTSSALDCKANLYVSVMRSDAKKCEEVTRAQWQAAVDALDIPKFPSDKVEWNGEGLPIEESIVNVRFPQCVSASSNHAVRILRIGKRKVFYADQSTGEEYAHSLDEVEFSVIRTPEQIAAEERLHEIRNALTAINSKVNFPDELVRGKILAAAVEAMIDAGYRKQEQE